MRVYISGKIGENTPSISTSMLRVRRKFICGI